MRRFLALIAVPLMACLTLAACSSGKSASSSSASAGATAGGGSVTATGAFDKAPKVTIPKAKPDNKLTVNSDAIVLALKDGQTVTIPPKQVTSLSYGQEAHRRVGTAIGLAVISLGVGALASCSP